jgi:hypothetical protein
MEAMADVRLVGFCMKYLPLSAYKGGGRRRVKSGPLGEGDRIHSRVIEVAQHRNNTDYGGGRPARASRRRASHCLRLQNPSPRHTPKESGGIEPSGHSTGAFSILSRMPLAKVDQWCSFLHSASSGSQYRPAEACHLERSTLAD